MKLTQPQLQQNLQTQALPPVIWISGDDPLLVQEAADAVRVTAKAQGIGSRQVIEADGRFDGDELIAANQSLSLFAERECIELRIHSKLSDKARKCLLEYLDNPNLDNLLLVISPRLEASQTKAKWFAKVEAAGWWLPVWPVEHHQLPKWIANRFKLLGLQVDSDAVELLADRVDGNLLAAKQEIEKLALLNTSDVIDAKMIIASVTDSSRYGVFDLSEALLKGELDRSLKILEVLRSEGVEPTIILWLLSRELRFLVELAEAANQGRGLPAVFKKLRIFENRQAPYRAALSRADHAYFRQCLLRCGRIDLVIKGQTRDDVWLKFHELILAICLPHLAQKLAQP